MELLLNIMAHKLSSESDREFQSLLINGIEFLYKAIREHRKTISIAIPIDKKLVIKTPIHFSKKDIEDFLQKKSTLIVKRLTKAEDRKKRIAKLEDSYKNGGAVLYLGKKYKLLVDNSKRRNVVKSDTEITIYSKNPLDSQDIRLMLNIWYQKQAEYVFSERLKEMIKCFEKMKEPELRIKSMKRQWGSYTDHVVTLNLHLIKTPIECIDYIILHELCHTYEKNHQKKFYELMESKLKNWKEIDKKLKSFAKNIILC